jgi:hypothetical protein
MDSTNAPAVVLQDSSEWGFAVDIADEANGCRVEISGNLDLILLGGADDWFYGQVIMQRLTAPAVDIANCSTDLSIAVGINVFLQEVDQSAISLQYGEDSQVRSGRGQRKQGLYSSGEFCLGQDSPQSFDGKPDSVQRSSLAMTIPGTRYPCPAFRDAA